MNDTGSLKVSSIVEGSSAAINSKAFAFQVRLNADISGTYSGVQFSSGYATFTLTGTSSKTIEGLPVGTSYNVSEVAEGGYAVTLNYGQNGVITTLASVALFTTRQASGIYTFYPEFQEYVAFLRGVVRVWLGDGETTGDVDVLYAEYQDEATQRLGPVSSYAIALQEGWTGTKEEWIRHIAETSKYALDAEAWAIGQRNGKDVEADDETYQNNSEWYANQSAASSKNSETSREASEKAQGNAEAAQKKAETAQAAAEQAQKNAEAFEDSAEAWAVGQINGINVGITDPRYENNSKYYAEFSAGKAKAAAESESAAATSEANALSYKNRAVEAEENANAYKKAAQEAQQAAETAQGKAETAQRKSEEAQNASEDARDLSEQYRDEAREARNGIFEARDAAAASAAAAAISEAAADNVKEYVYESRTVAEQAAITATADKEAAEAARDVALDARDTAVTAKNDAQTARTGAESAQTKAETANNSAQEAITKYPYIGPIDYLWRVWNTTNNEWDNTGVDARGLKGDKGDKGDPGQDGVIIDIGSGDYSFYVNDDGYLILVYGGDEAPNFYINDDGELVHVFGGDD